jgi:hypothetical protein
LYFITDVRGHKLFIRIIAIVAQSCPSSAGFVLQIGGIGGSKRIIPDRRKLNEYRTGWVGD